MTDFGGIQDRCGVGINVSSRSSILTAKSLFMMAELGFAVARLFEGLRFWEGFLRARCLLIFFGRIPVALRYVATISK